MVGGRIINVIARFFVDDRRFRRPLGRLLGLVKGLYRQLRRAALVGSAALGYMAKKALDFQRQTESARMSMAALLQQQSATPVGFTRSLEVADEVILKLRKDAAALPGTFDEMRDAFNTLIPVAGRAGSSLDEIRTLAGQVVVAARLGNVTGGADVVARDIRQILGGSASAAQISTVQLRAELPKLIALAKKDRREALKAIGEALAVSDEALAAYSRTFDAQFSTATDNFKQLVRVVSQPLFEAAVQELTELNEYIEKNRTSLEEQAKIWGKEILKAVRRVVYWVRDDLWPFLQKARDAVKDALYYWKEIALAIGGIKIASFVGAITGLPGTLKLVAVAVAGVAGAIGYANSELSELAQYARQARGPSKETKQATGRALGLAMGNPEFRAFANQALSKGGSLYGALEDATRRAAKNNVAAATLTGGLAGVAYRHNPEAMAALEKEERARLRRMMPLDRAVATGLIGQVVGRFNRPVFGPELPPPPKKPFELKTDDKKKPPVLDARGSTFNLRVEVVDGDPDRIALTLPDAMMRAFRPQLPGTPATP